MEDHDFIINRSDAILITGSNGFIGTQVVKTLLDYGFLNLRCFVRPSSDLSSLKEVINQNGAAKVELFAGDLLSQDDCEKLTEGIHVIYHLATAMRDTSFESSYQSNVITTRTLLQSVSKHASVRRFVHVSSFVVYSNMHLRRGALLDETCEREADSECRHDAYCRSKIQQEDAVIDHCKKHELSYVIVRPGVVYGPGQRGIHRMIGRLKRIGPLNFFIHLGDSNIIPLSFIDNCAEAIVLAGLRKGASGETFNVVDDDLLLSRSFLKLYKQNVQHIYSLYIPYWMFYMFSALWEISFRWAKDPLAGKFNRRKCAHLYKGNQYTNAKLKRLLGWKPRVNIDEALKRYYEYQRATSDNKY